VTRRAPLGKEQRAVPLRDPSGLNFLTLKR